MNFPVWFPLDELCFTNTGLENIPSTEDRKKKLLYLAWFILFPIRKTFGPLKITSAYRSPLVNEKAGGSINSQHTYGEAADFIPYNKNIKEIFEWIAFSSGIPFGQLILEERGNSRLIHISLPRVSGINNEVLYSPEAGKFIPYKRGVIE